MKSKTIKDVAKFAGVSISTVSRVLNSYKNVNRETHDLVMNAVNQVGYTPNGLARGLRMNSTRTIGLIVNNILNPLYSVMGHAIETTARKYGYQIFLCNSGINSEYENQYLNSLYEKKVDGIIIAPTGKNRDKLALFIDSGIPIVQVDRYVEGINADIVKTNNQHGSYELVSHLIKRDFRHIGVIVGLQTVSTGVERLTGYFNALADNGLSPKSQFVKFGNFDESSGYLAMKELLELPQKPDAVFVANNLMARGAIKAINEKGLKIPSDIAFGMYDDPDWAEMHNPPITVISQPTEQIGIEAAEYLIKRIQKTLTSEEPKNIIIPSELIVRQST